MSDIVTPSELIVDAVQALPAGIRCHLRFMDVSPETLIAAAARLNMEVSHHPCARGENHRHLYAASRDDARDHLIEIGARSQHAPQV